MHTIPSCVDSESTRPRVDHPIVRERKGWSRRGEEIGVVFPQLQTQGKGVNDTKYQSTRLL